MDASRSQSRLEKCRRWAGAALVVTLLLPAGQRAAAAQSDLGVVVCVGSELEIVMGANQVPGTFEKDVEFGYVTDVAPVYREEAERAVREQLVDYPRVRCVWSEPGDTHVAVVGYTAVVRLNRAIDPDDPRFPHLAVGYGTSWEDAEEDATNRNDRFRTFNDGSRHSFVMRQSWGLAEDVSARPEAPWEEPEGLFRDCDACPALVVIPPGTFMMGSPESEEGRVPNEQPRHPVTIEAPFAVGVYEVTVAEWDACALAGGCAPLEMEEDGRPDRERLAANTVSWEEIQAYLAWLSEETGERYRLLSEAEWEYVARAGTESARYWGEGGLEQCDYANGADSTALRMTPLPSFAKCADGYAGVAPVGMFAPNAFGLHDVLGNSAEWTQDCWNPLYEGAPGDGSAWEQGDCDVRVVRGGGWSSGPSRVRSAARFAVPTDFGYGFRVARELN